MSSKDDQLAARVAKEAAEQTQRERSQRAQADRLWPDKFARTLFESTMLRHHAETLAARYPASIWPATGGIAGTERDVHAAQAAFVAGIRFACRQLLDAAADLGDAADELAPEASA